MSLGRRSSPLLPTHELPVTNSLTSIFLNSMVGIFAIGGIMCTLRGLQDCLPNRKKSVSRRLANLRYGGVRLLGVLAYIMAESLDQAMASEKNVQCSIASVYQVGLC